MICDFAVTVLAFGMAIDKTAVKASTRQAKLPGVVTLEVTGTASGGTLEGTVLALLNSARAASPPRSPAKVPHAKSGQPQAFIESGSTAQAESIDPVKLATLQTYSRKLNEGLHKQGWMQVKTIRFRPKGENIDRKFVVESSLDPMDNSAVILRVSPASAAELPDPGPKYLTTEQAAKILNVSRPYVVGLADDGTLRGVMRTGANHRRIPESEVLRMSALMHTQMRKGMQEIEELNSDLRQRELDEARKTATRRWVAKAP